jgi:ankyrin repeat protein
MIKDNVGNTPLHCAARSNQLQICKDLFGITNYTTDLSSSSVINIVDEKNALGQTAVHVACEMGHKDIVEYFWKATNKNRKTGVFKRDDDRRSCLHVAAAKGKYIRSMSVIILFSIVNDKTN